MKTNNTTFCKFSTLLSICLIIYISVTTYIEHFYSQTESVDTDDFMFKIASLGILFIVLALLFSAFNMYKKSYLENKINERTNKILNENETLKIHSHIDTLTQCLNKKYFMERFDEEFKRAIREKQFISLLVVNIDEFKAFNDIYGRSEGDECIKLIANILVNHCSRSSDLVSRFSGDEFHILLPNTKEPKIVSQKCVETVKSLQIPHENSIASNVLTISIGISTMLPTHPNEINDLINRAKNSLEHAKKSGRNRVH